MDYRQLLNNPDPQLRIYALIQLEAHVEEVDDELVRQLLSLAVNDKDRTVAAQARRLESIFNQRSFGKRHNVGGFALFDDPRILEEPASSFLKGFDVVQLRTAAHDILYPVITRLHDIALGKRPGPIEKTVEALGSLRHPGSLPVLEKVARSRPALDCVPGALSHYAEARAEGLLLEMAGDEENPNRAVALSELGGLKTLDPFNVLDKAIQYKDPGVRKAAASALGEIATDDTSELLCNLLDDPDEGVVLAALGSLSRLRNPASLRPIVQRVLGTSSSKVRASAAIALSRLPSQDSQDVLVKLLADPDDRVRANAVEGLAQFDLSFEWVMRWLPPLLRDENHRVRGNAALAIFPYQRQMALDTVKKMFDSSNGQMRAAASYCASQIQNPDTAHWLATLVLTELDTEVLSSCLRALEKFNSKEVQDIFLKVTKHNKPEIRTLAVQLLGNIGTPAQVGFLMTMFKQEREPTTRSAIVSALAKLAGPEGLNFLPQYLSDPDERVVANAIDGLNRSGNLEVIAYLKPLLKHPNNRIRANTILALWNLGDTKCLGDLQAMLDSPAASFTESALYVMSAIGESLQLAELEAHPMLPIALRDYYKRVVERGEGLRSAPLELAESSRSGLDAEGPTTERLPIAGMPFPPSGPEPTGSAEFLDVIDKADMTPPLGTVTQRVNEEEELERILSQSLEDPEKARETLGMFTALYAKNPYGKYLLTRQLADASESLPDELVGGLERGNDDFLAPLFLLARAFRRQGEVERSLSVYLKIFRKELSMLTQMVDFGLQEIDADNPTPASTVMKTISAILGLKPDLHAVLGDFYLSEKAYDQAYQQFYMAHVAQPGDVAVALKLAFLCGKTKRKNLGRAICDLVMSREGAGTENYKKAEKILERLV